MTDRAVSETVGFVLVFALVTMTIGIVYASGFAGLHSAQDAERLANVERAFDVLNDNLRDIHQERSPSRATEIKLAGGSLALTESAKITFQTNSSEPGSCNETNPLSLSTRPLVYEHDQSSIAYVGGAVIRTDGPDGVMISDPPWLIRDDQSTIPIIGVVPQGAADSIGGQSTVLITARERSTSLSCAIDPNNPISGSISISTTEPYAEAWENYFRQQGYDVTRDSSTQVTATFDTDRLFVSRTTIQIGITN